MIYRTKTPFLFLNHFPRDTRIVHRVSVIIHVIAGSVIKADQSYFFQKIAD